MTEQAEIDRRLREWSWLLRRPNTLITDFAPHWCKVCDEQVPQAEHTRHWREHVRRLESMKRRAAAKTQAEKATRGRKNLERYREEKLAETGGVVAKARRI